MTKTPDSTLENLMDVANNSRDIEIPCPFCPGKGHRYAMEIRTVTVAGINPGQRELAVTRLFVCPVSAKEFQASIRVGQAEGERIVGVDITPYI